MHNTAKLHCLVNKSNFRESKVWLDNGQLLMVQDVYRLGDCLKLSLPSESIFIDFVNYDKAFSGEANTPKAPYRDNFGVLTFRLVPYVIMESSIIDPDGNILSFHEFKIEGSAQRETVIDLLVAPESFEILEFGREYKTGRITVMGYSDNLRPELEAKAA